MKNMILLIAGLLSVGLAWAEPETDSIPVENGEVVVSHIGHGTLMFEYDGVVIHIDPVGREADYKELPKADIILVTHGHGDHLDPQAIGLARKDTTVVIHNTGTDGRIDGGTVLKNGERVSINSILIEAVPAYNITEGRDRYHPKGRGNGYILTMGGKRFYVAGDTENHPEMLALEDIYVAFLPANQPYTMLPEQVVNAALSFRPEILYPYHYGNTDVQQIADALEDEEGIEVRIRDLQ